MSIEDLITAELEGERIPAPAKPRKMTRAEAKFILANIRRISPGHDLSHPSWDAVREAAGETYGDKLTGGRTTAQLQVCELARRESIAKIQEATVVTVPYIEVSDGLGGDAIQKSPACHERLMKAGLA